MPETTYTVVFNDGTEQNQLTYREAEEVMRLAELGDNGWVRVYVDPAPEYKSP